MTKDLGVFRNVLLTVFDRTKPGDYKHDRARQIYEEASRRWISFTNRDELLSYLPSTASPRTNFGTAKRFLYLEPVTEGGVFVPVLSLNCDFSRWLPEVGIRLALCFVDKSSSTRELRAIGYRFESPHGPGRHDYYHAQPIVELGNVRFPDCPEWFPTSQPALPLDGDGPVALVLCILASLYGMPYLYELEPQLGNTLKSYLSSLHWTNIPKLKYWQVTSPSGTHWYKSRSEPEVFKRFVKSHVHKKSRVKAATSDDYLARPPSEQLDH